ncbi:MAG: transposase family protein [Gemmatimonadaceae bacterium]
MAGLSARPTAVYALRPTVEAVPWLDRYQRMTTRIAEKIARLAQVLPIKHVAQRFVVSCWRALTKRADEHATNWNS